MNTTKPATKSLTLQAVAVTLLLVAYELIGVSIYGLPELPEVILNALVGAGLVVAGYGRYRAKDQLK